MPPSGVLKDTDKGFRKLVTKLKGIGAGKVLTVGIHAGEGESPDGKATLLEVATIHEYGLGHNPQRSFIRAWADDHESENRKALRSVGIEVLKGTYTIDVGLGRLGALFQGQIQARISSNIPPPLAPATIARKGSSVALIRYGTLRAAITWKVEDASG